MKKAVIKEGSVCAFDKENSHGIILKGYTLFVVSFPPSSEWPEFENGRVEIWHSLRLTPEIMGEERSLRPNEVLAKNKRSVLMCADVMGPLHAKLLRDALTQVIETSKIEY